MDEADVRPVFYKELSLLQMRSFVAASRAGSLSGAARALGIAQPTVWKQVQALQERFGAPLLVTGARGCRLTAEGRVLEEIMRPLLAEIDAIGSRFDEALDRAGSEVRVAASPRIIDEDLPGCVAAYKRKWPRVKLALRTATNREVSDLVLAGECDLGYTERGAVPRDASLVVDTVYELDVILLTPRRHPLARARRIDPGSLASHPMVTAASAIGYPEVSAQLHRHGVFSNPAPVEAWTAAGIRRYVRLGFGIGVTGGILTPAFRKTLAAEGLAARSMGGAFGRIPIARVRRKGGWYADAHHRFDAAVRKTMRQGPSRTR